jgi:hypothetical protein
VTPESCVEFAVKYLVLKYQWTPNVALNYIYGVTKINLVDWKVSEEFLVFLRDTNF